MIYYRVFLLLLVLSNTLEAQDFSFMTYNIRLDVASDGENRWSERKDILVSEVQFLSPNVFGIQEGLPHQTEYLKANLENYDFIGMGRDGGKVGEYSALFYDTSKFTVEQSNTFWLSETPDKFSMGWDAAYPRICTYALLADIKSGEKFWVFNAHLDHKGVEARQKGLALIRERIKLLNSNALPVILMGDFNTAPENVVIEELQVSMLDAFETAKYNYGSVGTFNGFNTENVSKKRIDYIFISKLSGYKVNKYAVLSNLFNNKYASDHFPVFVSIVKE